jgi:dipeptidyl aminopeptidase/acylaminoacyl peptidase
MAVAWGMSAIAAVPAADGEILSRTRCEWPRDSYDDYRARVLATYREDQAAAKRARVGLRPESELGATLLAEDEWRGRRMYRDYACERLLYSSDGLAVVAYLWYPARVAGRRLPLVVFNHGGFGDSGKLRPNTQFGFWKFVQADYVVLASQYRGVDGGQGAESFGDGDVRDVLNLFPLAEKLGFVDLTNTFMLGYSRGGMVTALAVRAGAPVNAAATVGGLFDLAALAADNPDARRLFNAAIPGAAASDGPLRERSAVAWPEQLGVPMLLLAGAGDGMVDAARNSLALAGALHARHHPYSLVVYDGDTHGLTFSAGDRDARILDWFARNRR